MDVVKEFFNRGYLLSPSAVEFLKGRDPAEYLNKKYDKIVLSADDLREIKMREVKIIKNLTSVPEELTTETFLNFYNSKYEKMKNIFISKMGGNFVSINKIGKREKVTTIGMVKNIKEREGKKIIELEDITGSINVIYKGDVELDDVIAVRGMAAGNVIYADEVIYPDVPLRPPATGSGRILLMSGLDLDEAPETKIEKLRDVFNNDYDYCIIVGNVGDVKKLESLLPSKKTFVVPGIKDSNKYPSPPINVSGAIPLSNPSMIDINGVKILMVTNFKMDMIRKRYLGKSSLILDEDFLVMDEIPDIIVSNGPPNIKNYKSITIINCGTLLDTMRPVIVDLKTREWNELGEI